MAIIGAIFITCGASILFTAFTYSVDDWNKSRTGTNSEKRKKPCTTR